MFPKIKCFHAILHHEPPGEINDLFFAYEFKNAFNIASDMGITNNLCFQHFPGGGSIGFCAMSAFKNLITVKLVCCAECPLLHQVKDSLDIYQLPALTVKI